MKYSDFSNVAQDFRKSIEEALNEINDIRRELPEEMNKTMIKLDKLEETINKQKKMLEGFMGKR